MNIYQISCYSTHGSYFNSYLKSVTVLATTEEEAIALCKKWQKKEGEYFIYPQDKWRIHVLVKDCKTSMVIDSLIESDY